MKISEIFPEVLMEDLEYEFKQVLSEENPIKWAKTIVAYANNGGGTIFVGVSNDGDAFGLTLNEIDKMKNLVARINDRNIFPHVRISYVIGSVDENAERYVLGIRVFSAESVVRYREGDFNETVYIRGDGNSYPARPEEIISLSKKRYGIDNETTEVFYSDSEWNDYLALCRNYRNKRNWPSIKELQNEEILSKDEHVKSGFLMFKDDYDKDDTMALSRLCIYISQIRLEQPITFVGFTALSVDTITNFFTLYLTLKSAIIFVPQTLFCTLSLGLSSIMGTCLYAAAWNT